MVREAAEEFRRSYVFSDGIPVGIELIIQQTMGIQTIPMENLQLDCDMEGYISRDFRYIYVDKRLYDDDNYYKRVRFTIAHEIGHLVLHRSKIEMMKFNSEDEWKNFRIKLENDSLIWFEWQANEFAGRLLVPLDQIVIAFKEARTEILKKNISWNAPKIDDEDLFSMIAPIIAPKFDVSPIVIEKRITKEKIINLIH
jgi:Zn-dependent peptidase ImmA (M78 family)